MRRALLAGMALALLATALPSSVVTATDTSPDRTIPWAGSVANHPGYWEDFFSKPGRVVTCVKYDIGGDSITIGGGHRRLVIKNDQRNLIWVNPPAGAYASVKGVSHYFLCDWDKKTVKRLAYTGRILGPCGDPYYTAKAKNRRWSTRAVTVVLTADGRQVWKRTLQPGDVVQPRARWYPAGVLLVLRRGNGDNIDRERTVSGTFPWTECR